MVLYKYVSAERIDILQNRLIRFTQPNAMNDPFEARPYFEAFATKEGFASAFAHSIRQNPRMWKDFQRATQTILNQQAFADKLETNPDYADQLYKNSGLQDPLPDERKRVYRWFNNVGILSLSGTRDNMLMWAHYTEGHTGFVLVLDDSHDFFKGGDSTQGFAKPEPVQYSSDRPRTTIEEVTLSEIFLIKSADWKYEKELRYLKFRDGADKRIVQPNTPPIELFRLPPKCIMGVILGCYTSEDLKDKIVSLRRDDPEFEHLQIQHAGMSTKHYRLIIKKIET